MRILTNVSFFLLFLVIGSVFSCFGPVFSFQLLHDSALPFIMTSLFLPAGLHMQKAFPYQWDVFCHHSGSEYCWSCMSLTLYVFFSIPFLPSSSPNSDLGWDTWPFVPKGSCNIWFLSYFSHHYHDYLAISHCLPSFINYMKNCFMWITWILHLTLWSK